MESNTLNVVSFDKYEGRSKIIRTYAISPLPYAECIIISHAYTLVKFDLEILIL